MVGSRSVIFSHLTLSTICFCADIILTQCWTWGFWQEILVYILPLSNTLFLLSVLFWFGSCLFFSHRCFHLAVFSTQNNTFIFSQNMDGTEGTEEQTEQSTVVSVQARKVIKFFKFSDSLNYIFVNFIACKFLINKIELLIITLEMSKKAKSLVFPDKANEKCFSFPLTSSDSVLEFMFLHLWGELETDAIYFWSKYSNCAYCELRGKSSVYCGHAKNRFEFFINNYSLKN